MRTFKGWVIVTACVAVYAMPILAGAQQPPQLETLEESEEPTVTIREPQQERRISERRAPGGKVTEIRVTVGNSTYYLRPNDQVGSALPGDAQSSTMRAAQWQVLAFDLPSPQEVREAEAAADVPPPPPPPAVPDKK